ncbi:MAG: glycosyl hydrolase family 2 [Prevotella sp.]|nr:glycosyl hydrolase family 2 [Prevotella sp.]
MITVPVALMAQDGKWPEQTPTSKAGSRWWWLGSAVDNDNLRWNIQEYAKIGIGSLEITPIYGVKGNEKNELGFLTAPWMEALKFAEEEGKRNGVLIDMNAGTGWPFGGPNVPIEEAACKAVFVDTVLVGADFKDIDISAPEKERKFSTLQKAMAFGTESKAVIDVTDNIVDGRLNWKTSGHGKWRFIALYIGRTRQQVKRAAPNGEGYVIDHFDRNAVKHYLENLERGFAASSTPYPHTFFNDSYEVYGADWTPTLLQEFKQRRGYDLAERFDRLLDRDPQVISDYRETLGDMLLENFTEQWTAWAHSHGALTRNQAHGSPANLIDVYAAVDIPEIEGFGLSEFGIKGLRKDSGYTRKNDSDVSMLKYASSAAHITGKPLTSSETFTWLTEHFRTSLSQMKPDLDLMFTCGVNHVFFHGTTYSPKNDPWPGWKFYASVDMSPTNNIWRDAPELMKYIDRSQRFLQMGKPDNDFLIYLPVRDMWKQNTGKRLLQFDIHGMAKKAPQFIKDVLTIDKMGYDVDYISDRYLLGTTFENGMLKTAAGTRYKALILPTGCTLPENVRQHLEALKANGAKVISHIDARQISDAAQAEQMRLEGLRALRRSNDNGHHYFIANLTPNDVCKRMKLAVDGKSATWYNPMNGDIVAADFNNDGVMVKLRSGESRILVVSNNAADNQAAISSSNAASTSNSETITLDGKWTLSFINSAPKVSKTFTLQSLQTWEGLDDDSVKVTMGTGVYSTTLKLNKKQAKQHWTIDLGDVRESARVYINDQYIGCAWAVPFVLDCKDALKAGNNTIRIEVTNLPANRIAWLDHQGVEWRKFKEINVVDINYKKTNYADWAPVPSGLNSKVRLIGKIK